MILYVDETENENYFIVAGLLANSREEVSLAYKRFSNIAHKSKISKQYRTTLFQEYKSTMMDKNFQRLKIHMLEEINRIDHCVIFSCHIKKNVPFVQKLKEVTYIDKHHPSWKRIPPETQMRLDLGNEFGDQAMSMFGPYVEMTVLIPGKSYPDKQKMVYNTKHHLAIGTANICEAAFEWNGHYCAVDILHKTPTGYEMYEVKNAPEVKEQFIKDAGFQAYILEKAGTNPQKIFIVYHGEDESNPFVPVEVTEEARAFASVVEANISRLDTMKMQCEEVYAEPGEQCDRPYECWYKHICSQQQLTMFR